MTIIIFTPKFYSNYFSQYFTSKPTAESPLDQLRDLLKPDNTVVVTDIHDVITCFSLTAALKAFWDMQLGHKLHFTKKTKDYFLHNQNPKRSFEYVALCEKGDDPVYVEQAIALMNPHVPKAETVAILDQLNTQGYPIYGCSNIGEQSYKYMQTKYPAAFKHLIACRTTNAANGFKKKKDPSAQAYQETLGLIKQNPKHIIVFDDKKENLELAHKTDPRFTGILFKKPKQLELALKKLNMIN